MGYAIQPFEPLAVVGMDVDWGGCDDLDAFERMIYEASARPAPVQSTNLKEAENQAADPRLVKVARRALLDAGINPDALNGLRVAILFAGCLSGDRSWDWASSQSDLTGHPNPLEGAVKQAGDLLKSGAADAVLFAAATHRIASPDGVPVEQDRSGLGFDRDIHGWRFGAGAGAVVWMSHTRAVHTGRRVYAVVRSMAAVSVQGENSSNHKSLTSSLPAVPSLQAVRGCCQDALEAAGMLPDQVAYLEAFASGQDTLDGVEIAGTVQAYRRSVQDLTTAIGSVQVNLGYMGAAAGLAGLVRTALCLYHRSIPGVPGWSAPKLPALWRGAPFYVPVESRAWFEKRMGTGRVAALNVFGLSGSFAHLIISEAPNQPVRTNRVLVQGGFYLFPLAGSGLDDLTGQLKELQRALSVEEDIKGLASECYQMAFNRGPGALSLVIVGHHPDELSREIDLALKALPTAFQKEIEWQTPLGSYFTPQPAGRQGGVALVYPGAFNSYPGVGKDLFHLIPSLHQRGDLLTSDLGSVFRERLLYPRSLTAFSKEEMADQESALLSDAIAMLISGAALSVFYTHILQETFALRPSAAFGYSLGENSMLFATGVWAQADAAAARLEHDEAFRIRLAGPQDAIREYWGLSPSRSEAAEKRLWANYLVMAAPEKVQAALENEPRVYLTHINTPRQVVIGGDPEACQRVLAGLRCSSLQAPFDYALHCDVMRSEYDALAELHNWPVERDPDLHMYSAADYGPLNLDQTEVSNKIAHMLTTALDFPRLIRKVYEDGARVFIEVGAGSNCARWIDETLKGSPHLALSMNRRGTDDYHTLVRTLARLYSHQVPMDLSVLYAPETVKVNL